MTKDTSQHQKEFYEEYWKQKEDENYLYTQNNVLPHRIKVAVDMILEESDLNGSEPKYVLDIGCGEGTLGKILDDELKDKINIIGCDISEKALEIASTYYSEVFQYDIEKNKLEEKFNNQNFDYIVILEVLEHLFKPRQVLKQCYTVLKDEGVLIASFPNIAWYKYRIEMLKGYFPKNYLLYPGEHIQNFTLYSFNKLLLESGFSPIDIDGEFRFPNVLKPSRFFSPLVKKFPNLFGYQLVIKSKKKK